MYIVATLLLYTPLLPSFLFVASLSLVRGIPQGSFTIADNCLWIFVYHNKTNRLLVELNERVIRKDGK